MNTTTLPANVPVRDIEAMAEYVVKSRLFGVGDKAQAVALMLLAQAEGIHPMTAARDYHIIQGRPSMKADTMLARFQAAGGKVKWMQLTDQAAEAVFTHPQGECSDSIRWTLDDAKRAGLLDRDLWKKYPRAMLRSRVISEGIRTVYPSVICGIYTDEEVTHFSTPVEKDITPAPESDPDQPVHQHGGPVDPKTGEVVSMTLDEAKEWIDRKAKDRTHALTIAHKLYRVGKVEDAVLGAVIEWINATYEVPADYEPTGDAAAAERYKRR